MDSFDENSGDDGDGWVSDEFGDEFSDEFGDEFTTKPEADVFNRTGQPGISELLCGGGGGGEINRLIQDPKQRFACYVNAISMNLMNEDSVKLGNEDINNMLKKIHNLTNVGRKNPTAYIMGYLATNNGIKLDKKSFNRVINNVLPLVDVNAGVTPPDVVRYAVLWETL
jgi:hypothetical protein